MMTTELSRRRLDYSLSCAVLRAESEQNSSHPLAPHSYNLRYEWKLSLAHLRSASIRALQPVIGSQADCYALLQRFSKPLCVQVLPPKGSR
jgi:hypothetical protein